ncbi:LacI family DNA-binding transcriptional regulator [Microbacterium sp.]|uniref:LacI family DNA-binding transcriptional regulator n=1 Tax=Microbacterium sp. TaxID=51671 RepID=UPI003A91C7CD
MNQGGRVSSGENGDQGVVLPRDTPKHPRKDGRGSPRATIRDVAARAGVSSATVSRVLNGAGLGKVSENALARVTKAIEDLRFEPSPAARALATRRSRTIGILTLTEIFSPAMLSFELQRAAQDAGYNVSVATITSPDAEVVTTTAFHVFREVEGLIALAPTHDSKQILDAVGVDVPTVVVEGTGGEGTSSISMDQKGGAILATEHLIAQGARTIRHVAGPEAWPVSQARLTGWREALARHDLPEAPVVRGDWTSASGYRAGIDLLKSGRFDAVFVANDHMALGVMSALHDAGVSVPGEVLVVGFDDLQDSPYLTPKLTTVRQDYRHLGQQAVNDLVGLLDGRSRDEIHRVLPVHLVVRESSTRERKEK